MPDHPWALLQKLFTTNEEKMFEGEPQKQCEFWQETASSNKQFTHMFPTAGHESCELEQRWKWTFWTLAYDLLN